MSVAIFEHINFSGRTLGPLDRDVPSMGNFWNDKISSIKVYAGTWDFFEHANFQGRRLRLGPGEYPSFNNETNDTISSFKKADGSHAPSEGGVPKRILDLTNRERGKVGVPPLALNSQLTAAAQKHSQSMAIQDFFDHRQMEARVRAEGYPYPRVAENISAGNPTPEDAIRGWMNSPGHRANLLNPQYRELGVGYYFLANDPGSVNYKHYWTQVFGAPQ